MANQPDKKMWDRIKSEKACLIYVIAAPILIILSLIPVPTFTFFLIPIAAIIGIIGGVKIKPFFAPKWKKRYSLGFLLLSIVALIVIMLIVISVSTPETDPAYIIANPTEMTVFLLILFLGLCSYRKYDEF